ncbi:hypothetical protein M8C21_023443 [Ambrosia artemisiifolia]|uniref:Uncharacterized protein n=1 Tax=Ambrosia artemisiifolia TaxID=4212 RepID=A0AAD5GT07_AMBAR|nr:hypothetical protein M8C21_023443 [Ambrosia artemisiifolia]
MPNHPPPVDLRSATQILNQTTTIFSTRHHLPTLLTLSILFLCLRTNLENLTTYLTTHIDTDPSIQSLLSSPPTLPIPTTTHHRHHHHRRRRPFLQLTRVGTLDDDFFSGDEDLDQRFFGNVIVNNINHTQIVLDSFHPNLGFSRFVSDNGIRVSEIVRSSAKMSFRLVNNVTVVNNTNNSNDNGSVSSVTVEGKSGLQLLFDGVGLEHDEMNTLLWLIGVLSGCYGVMIVAYVFTHVWVHGVVFVVVVNEFLGRDCLLWEAFEKGAILGAKRLSGFVIMRWVIRDAWTQLLGVLFFGEIEDQYSLFKIFVRLKFMPFSMVTPWVKGFEKEIYFFMLSWFLLDMVMSFVFALDPWVAMVDSRLTGKQVFKEGCRLLSIMISPAINLKCFEGIVCGSFGRHVLTYFFGQLLASMIQSFMEVYFMVAWMIHYLVVKSIDARSNGTPFGRSELETMLRDDR